MVTLVFDKEGLFDRITQETIYMSDPVGSKEANTGNRIADVIPLTKTDYDFFITKLYGAASRVYEKIAYSISCVGAPFEITDSTTSRPVVNEAFTSSFDAAVSLAYVDIDSSITPVVTSSDGVTTYTENTDYTIDYTAGTITVLSSGSMDDATSYLIDYTYKIPYPDSVVYRFNLYDGANLYAVTPLVQQYVFEALIKYIVLEWIKAKGYMNYIPERQLDYEQTLDRIKSSLMYKQKGKRIYQQL